MTIRDSERDVSGYGYRVIRLLEDDFYVEHPDGRLMKVKGHFSPPCSLSVERGPKRTVVIDVPREELHTIAVLQDLGWLWDQPLNEPVPEGYGQW